LSYSAGISYTSDYGQRLCDYVTTVERVERLEWCDGRAELAPALRGLDLDTTQFRGHVNVEPRGDERE